jgi:hypothetical protein
VSRLLLFDSHCVKCSSAAEEITRLTGGRVTPQSLRDPAIRRSLDRDVPGWRARPMLVDVDETGRIVRAYSGPRFVATLVSTAGIRGTIRVLRNITDGATQRPGDPGELTRRGAIARATGVVGGVLVGTSVLGADALAASSEPRTLGAAHPALRRLSSSAAIREAEKTFGAADWRNVIAGDGVYVVTHATSPDVYTAVAQAGAAAVSFRVSPGSRTEPWKVDWVSTSGVEWVTSTAAGTIAHRGTGRVHRAPGRVAIVPDVSYPAWLERFQVCLGRCPIPSIVAICRKCADTGNPHTFSCISCGARLGYNGIKCAIWAAWG